MPYASLHTSTPNPPISFPDSMQATSADTCLIDTKGIDNDQDTEKDKDVKAPVDAERLRGFLVDTVAYACDITSDEVEVDPEDNAIYIENEGSRIVLKVIGDSSNVLMKALLVADLEESPELHKLLNLLNEDLVFGRMYFDGDTIVFEMGFMACWLSRDQLIDAVDGAAGIDQDYSPRIKERLGGTLVRDEQPEDEIDV